LSSLIGLILVLFCIFSLVHAQVEVKLNAATALLLIPSAGFAGVKA